MEGEIIRLMRDREDRLQRPPALHVPHVGDLDAVSLGGLCGMLRFEADSALPLRKQNIKARSSHCLGQRRRSDSTDSLVSEIKTPLSC